MIPPRFLVDRWDETGKIPLWARPLRRLLWPRLHFCRELDGLLVTGKKTDFYCDCVEWPPEWALERTLTNYGREPEELL